MVTIKTQTLHPSLTKAKNEDPRNYRPVSLTSVPGKIMGKVFLELISTCMRDKKVTGNSQHVFTTGESRTQFLSTMRQAALRRKVSCFFRRLQLYRKLGWQEFHEGLYDKSCNWQKNPDATEQTESWLTNKQLWRKWPSRLVEKWNIRAAWPCFKEGQLHTGLFSSIKADHKPTPGVQHARANFECPETRKRSTAGTRYKTIREHCTSRGWENWFCSSEHNLT